MVSNVCVKSRPSNTFFSSEMIEVGYDPQQYMTSEGDGNVILSIRVFSHPGGAPRPFTLVVNTQDGTASMYL